MNTISRDMNKFALCFSLLLLLSCAKKADELHSSDTMNTAAPSTTGGSTQSLGERFGAPSQKEPKKDSAIVVKVFVSPSDKITADGTPVTLTQLDAMFKSLHGHKAGVLYSRGDGSQEPSDTALSVMELIAKYRLPMQFYTDSTFTVPIKG